MSDVIQQPPIPPVPPVVDATQTQPPVPPVPPTQEPPVLEPAAEADDPPDIAPIGEADHVNMLMWVHGYFQHMLAQFANGRHPDLDHTKQVEKTLREHLEKI